MEDTQRPFNPPQCTADGRARILTFMTFLVPCLIVSWSEENSRIAVVCARFVSWIFVNYARTGRKWMALTAKFPPLKDNLRARKPFVVPLCHRVWACGKIYGCAFDRRGAAPTAALSHTVDDQVICNLLYIITYFSSKGTEAIEFELTCAAFATTRKIWFIGLLMAYVTRKRIAKTE